VDLLRISEVLLYSRRAYSCGRCYEHGWCGVTSVVTAWHGSLLICGKLTCSSLIFFISLVAVCLACDLLLFAVTTVLFSVGIWFSCSDGLWAVHIWKDNLWNLSRYWSCQLYSECNITESKFTHGCKGHTCYSVSNGFALIIFE